MSQFRPLSALAASVACRLLRWTLRAAGGGGLGVRLRAIPAVRPASLFALASLALAAVLFAIPADRARAHDVSAADYHNAVFPLIKAVKADDLDFVNHFIAEHEENIVNDADGFGETPLHAASNAATGHVTIAATLIAAGANVNATDFTDETPLHWAAEYGHASIVSLLIAATASLNLKNKFEGRTPLYMAARNGHVFVVSMLIAAKASLDVQGAYGQTPLHQAANYGRVTIADMLIAAGASLNVRSSGGDTPLYWAVFSNEVSIASALIAAGADVHAGQTVGLLWTPLLLAASKGRASIADMLIAEGATLDARDVGNNTPLHLSAGGGHAAMVSLLIQATASLNVKNDDDKAPLHLAADGGHSAIVADLIAAGAYWGDAACESGEIVNPAGPTPPCLNLLREAVKRGNLSAVSALIAAGVDVDARNANNNNTALHLAADAGRAAMVSLLIQATASLNVKNNAGNTPLHLSAEAGHVAVVSLLIQATASLNVKNNTYGDTPLHVAAFNGRAAIVDALIAAGAGVNEQNNDDQTPLHFGVYSHNVGIVDALIAARASVNAEDVSGQTPLWWAANIRRSFAIVAALIAAGAYWGDAPCESGLATNPVNSSPPCIDLHQAVRGGYVFAVATLIATGATLDAQDGDGDTPLHLAADGGHAVIASLLIQATASLNVQNDDGRTPLHLAVGGNHGGIVAALLAAKADVNLRDSDENTPLHWAHFLGRPALVADLIAAGGYWGAAACESGEIVNPAGPIPPCLCEPPTVGTAGNCAAPSKESCGGLDPEQFYDAEADVCVLFVTCGPGEVVYKDVNDCHAPSDYPLIDAVRAGDLDLVNHFITVHMLGVNDKNNFLWAPLHYAAGLGHVPIVTALIAAGATVDVRNDSNATPLHRAVSSRHISVVATLLAEGADVNARNYNRRTPLSFTRGALDAAIVALLIAEGGHWGTDCASIGEAVNPATNVPPCIDLHQAAAGGHVFAVATLIATGATLDAQDGDGDTPLHAATRGGHAAVVSLLIQATASLNVQRRRHAAARRANAVAPGRQIQPCRHCRRAACGGGGCEFAR